MKISFLGLSCFMIENSKGYRVLIDPFNDSPEWTLGVNFPKTFNGEPVGVNIVLSTEPDADHSTGLGDLLENAPKTQPGSNPFPDFNVRGVIVHEWNGDINIAWQYTIDGVRFAHFADNAHKLTEQQLLEIGGVDVVFMSPQKPQPETHDQMVTINNIKALDPKIVFWAHHITPVDLPDSGDAKILRPYFQKFFKKNASTNRAYKDSDSFMQLCYLLESAHILNDYFGGKKLYESSIEIEPDELLKSKEPKAYFFMKSVQK